MRSLKVNRRASVTTESIKMKTPYQLNRGAEVSSTAVKQIPRVTPKMGKMVDPFTASRPMSMVNIIVTTGFNALSIVMKDTERYS